MEHPLARYLVQFDAYSLGNGTVCHPSSSCYCEGWLHSRGSNLEKQVAQTLQWVTFGMSVATLLWYAFQGWRATCGWEEVYVALVEMIKSIIEAFYEFDTPAMLYLSTGSPVVWLRYAEWLLTCPVLLIHLSNLTGLNNDYSLRTMGLLVSDVGCIVLGATAAMSKGYLRLIFFLIGCAYGGYTFFHAWKVYIEAYHTVPKGTCRRLVVAMAWVYFTSWTMFPILFAVGPEGFGHMSLYGSSIGHCILDMFSKNIWGIIGNTLRVKIHQHINLYGDIRKKQTIMIAGQEVEIESFAPEDDDGSGENSSKVVIKVRPRASTDLSAMTMVEIPTRPSFAGQELSKSVARISIGGALAGTVSSRHSTKTVGLTKVVPRISFGTASSANPAAAAAATDSVGPGRVVLAVPDASMLEVFQEQFSAFTVPYEVIPALTVDQALEAATTAAQQPSGCDFVLMHPDFLRDRSVATGLLPRLRAASQRSAAFGWCAKGGAVTEMIEEAPLDGWLEGPSFGRAISHTALVQLVVKMQQMKQSSVAGTRATGEGGGGGTGSGDQQPPAQRLTTSGDKTPIGRPSRFSNNLVSSNWTGTGSGRATGSGGEGLSNSPGSMRGTGAGTGTGAAAEAGRSIGTRSVKIVGGGLVPVGSGSLSQRLTGQGSGRAPGSGSPVGSGSSGAGSGRLLSGPPAVASAGMVIMDVDSAFLQPPGQQQPTGDNNSDAITSLSVPNLLQSNLVSAMSPVSPRPGSRLSNNPLFRPAASPRGSQTGGAGGLAATTSTATRPLSPLQPVAPITPAAANGGPTVLSAFEVNTLE